VKSQSAARPLRPVRPVGPVRVGLWIGLFFLMLYGLYAGGVTREGDSLWQYLTGEAIYLHHTLDMTTVVPDWNKTPEKPLYCYNTIGPALLFLPFIALEQIFPIKQKVFTPQGVYEQEFYFASFMNVVIGAILAFFFYQFCFLLTGDRRASIIATMAHGLTSYSFFLSIIWRDVMPAMTAGFVALYAVAVYHKQARGWTAALAAGCAAGLAGCCRQPYLGIIPIIGLYLLIPAIASRSSWKKILLSALVFGAGCLLFLAPQGYFNYIKFGNVFTFYAENPTKMLLNPMAILSNLLSYVVSPGGSVFAYSPLLLLSIPGFVLFYRKEKALFWCIVSAVVMQWGFYSLLQDPHWNGAVVLEFGNRYAGSVIAFLFLPSVYAWSALPGWKIWEKKAVRWIVVLGFLFAAALQLFILSVNTRQPCIFPHVNYPEYTSRNLIWDIRQSHILRMYNRVVFVLKQNGMFAPPRLGFVKDFNPEYSRNFNFWASNFDLVPGARQTANLMLLVMFVALIRVLLLLRGGGAKTLPPKENP
jgi:hypothetical protein